MDVTILVELAEKGHRQEIFDSHSHVAKQCDKCLAIARAVRMLEQADEVGGNVVLYIP